MLLHDRRAYKRKSYVEFIGVFKNYQVRQAYKTEKEDGFIGRRKMAGHIKTERKDEHICHTIIQ